MQSTLKDSNKYGSSHNESMYSNIYICIDGYISSCRQLLESS